MAHMRTGGGWCKWRAEKDARMSVDRVVWLCRNGRSVSSEMPERRFRMSSRDIGNIREHNKYEIGSL